MITDMISTAPGFQTSVNISYDLNNPDKIRGLIPTTAAIDLFEDFLISTDNASTNRARILIGAYGKGKSHIILSILSFLCRKDKNDSAALLNKVKETNPNLYDYALEYIHSSKKLLPVIINGTNTSLVQSFMGALHNTLKQYELTNLMPDTHFQAAIKMIALWEKEYPKALVQFQKAINMPVGEFIARLADFDVEAYTSFERIYPSLTAGSEFNPFAGFDVVELYEKVNEKLPNAGYTGIFVVYDEFSKYLESSISKASISDIKMLQDFAEKCCRSGHKQLHLLLISHKEIENYIDILPKQKVDGWKGVSERFSHVHMHSDFAQIYEIVAQAIVKEPARWEQFYAEHSGRFIDLEKRYRSSSLFLDCSDKALHSAVSGCYPLHPITTFMLPRISEKVAQNERTLFTFISGQEATTLSGALKALDGEFPLVTPDALYDYFAPQMRKEVYNSEIHQLYRLVSGILVKFDAGSLHAKIVKSIALIYCLGQFERLAPTVDTMISIYADDEISAEQIKDTIVDLVQKQCVVYLKRSNAYLKLKESSGIDVYSAISDVVEKRKGSMTAAALLNAANREPYAYPIRYNDKFEMTRFFQFIFIDAADIYATQNLQTLVDRYDADGVIFGILPIDDEQKAELTAIMEQRTQGIKRSVFVLPENVSDILINLRNLDAVQLLRDAAQGDDVLFDEYDVIYQDLSEVVHRFISQYTRPEAHAAKYYYAGVERTLYRKAHLSQLLSDICDETYPNTPIINNEVLNKNKLTTVALNSRTKLLAGLMATPLQPNLGLSGSGQDVSFMRSALVVPGVLVQSDSDISLNLTPANKALANVLAIIEKFFEDSKAKNHASFSELYNTLIGNENCIGMRKGLIPIYLAAVLRKYQKHIVIRDQFSEVIITPNLINQINDKPDQYTVKVEEWTDTKQSFIAALDNIFADYIYDADRGKNNYSYLSIAMGRWYLALPKYAKELKQQYNGMKANEQYTLVDRPKQKFLALLKQPSIGALDLLFSCIPKYFGFNDVSEELSSQIIEAKKFYDHAKLNLENALISDVKMILCDHVPAGATLSSAISDWYESLSSSARSKLYPNGAERIFSVIEKATNDEHLLVEGLARVLTGLRIDDWNEGSIKVFLRRLSEYKSTIEAENRIAPVQEKSIPTETSKNYSIVFAGKDGRSYTKSFDRVECSKRAGLLYNRISNTIKEMGQSISPQEKRQILMDILEELC